VKEVKTIRTLLAVLLLTGIVGLGATSVMATIDFEIESWTLPDEIQDYEIE